MRRATVFHRELLAAMEQSRRLLRVRLGFIAAIGLVCAWVASPALGLGWALATAGLEALGAFLSDRTGYAPGDRVETARRVAIVALISAAWALGPVLAWPLQTPDTRLGVYIWVASLILYTSVFNYRALAMFAMAMVAEAAAVVTIIVWGAADGSIKNLPASLCVAGMGVAFAVLGALRRRSSDIQIERVQEEMKGEVARAEAAATRLRFTLDALGAAIWEVDFARRQIIGGDQINQILHKTMTFDDFVNGDPVTVHANDQVYVRTSFERAIAEAGKLDIEHRIKRPDGVVCWVHTIGFTVANAAGEVTRLVLMTTDETERKNLEMEFAAAMRVAEAALADKRALLDRIPRSVDAPLAGDACPPMAEDRQGDDQTRTSVEGFKALYGRLDRLLKEIDARDAALGEAFTALEASRAAAEAANVAKSQFVANMSHELRTPLNAVIGYAEILEEDLGAAGLSAPANDAQRIRAAARNLLGLINDILDLAKIESGKMDASIAEVDVPRLVREAVDLVRPAGDAKDNLIEVHIDPAVSRARTDETKLRQCLLNLLSNACKFTERGRIVVTVGEERGRDGALLSFSVLDTGIGIAPGHLDKLFTPFTQADASTTRRYGGTGLGLAITKKMAQVLGGDVRVVSGVGAGSTFTLTIRAALDKSAAEMGELAGDGPLVLIIDDEADARDLVKRSLARLSFATRSTGSGRLGLQMARAIQPALIVLDIRLPDLSGWRVLEELKSDAATNSIPVIVLTIEDDRARALALGASAHLLKPTDRETLAAAALRHAAPSAVADPINPPVRVADSAAR